MEFLDPIKKRQHRIRLYVGYVLMVIAISIVSLLLVLQAYGYTFDFQTGDIDQNGLVFIDAHPEQADVYVNGELKGPTDQRLIMPAQKYTINIRREGYRPWEKSINLLGGKIERLVYPVLFPETLDSKETQLYAAKPPFATQSPDRRWLIVGQPGAPFSFDLVDLNTELGTAARLVLPNDLFNTSGAKHDIQVVEWSTDNRHVVLKHSFDTGSEFVLIDREVPGSSQNLSRIFNGTVFTDIVLRDKRFDRYYLHNRPTQALMSAELNNGVVAPLLNGVLEFKPHGDDVLLYVSSSGAAEGNVAVRVREGDQIYTVKELPVDTTYILDLARFSNRWYIVAGAPKDQRIYVLRNPVAALQRNPQAKIIPAAQLRIENPQYVSFSANARFVEVQSGSKFVVYDAETDQNYRYDTGLALPAPQKATWMDGHRLSLVSNNRLNVFDFDGTNKQELSPAYPEFTPYFNSNYTAVYTLADSHLSGRATLLRTELVVKPAE